MFERIRNFIYRFCDLDDEDEYDEYDDISWGLEDYDEEEG